MEHVGTYDAKNRLSELLDKVQQGDEVIITRNGKPVAKLVLPDDGEDKRERARQAACAIRNLRKSLPDDVLEGASLKELIGEGRR